jgi:hypothetical protein
MSWEQVAQVVGVVGGVLGVINTLQNWRRNRPRVSVICDRGDTERELNVVVHNHSDRPIVITRTRCVLGDSCELCPVDYMRQIEEQRQPPWLIGPRSSETFALKPITEDSMLLFISWDSTAAFILSFIPLVVLRTRKQIRRLFAAQPRPE